VSAKTFFVVIPLRGDPYKYAEGWLKTDKTVRKLKVSAEEEASKEAAARADSRS